MRFLCPDIGSSEQALTLTSQKLKGRQITWGDKISASALGRGKGIKQSPDLVEKRRAALLEYWASRKQKPEQVLQQLRESVTVHGDLKSAIKNMDRAAYSRLRRRFGKLDEIQRALAEMT